MKTGQGTAKIILIASIVVFLFYFVTLYVIKDVYTYALTGALFEVLALPILSMLVALPFVNIYMLLRYMSVPRQYILYSFILLLLTAGMIWLKSSRT